MKEKDDKKISIAKKLYSVRRSIALLKEEEEAIKERLAKYLDPDEPFKVKTDDGYRNCSLIEAEVPIFTDNETLFSELGKSKFLKAVKPQAKALKELVTKKVYKSFIKKYRTDRKIIFEEA